MRDDLETVLAYLQQQAQVEPLPADVLAAAMRLEVARRFEYGNTGLGFGLVANDRGRYVEVTRGA